MPRWIYPTDWDARKADSEPIPDYRRDPYSMDLSLQEVGAYLKRVGACIRAGHFHILTGDPDDPAASRGKNARFMRSYFLYDRKELAAMLLSLDAGEFCHVKRCNDGRDLYVFCAARTLYKQAVGYELVRIYVKHDYDSRGEGADVVVSLHELEKPILLAFEE